jgi:hypothetical protein
VLFRKLKRGQGKTKGCRAIVVVVVVVAAAAVTIIIQFNSIYLCAKLNSPEANYKVITGKKMK